MKNISIYKLSKLISLISFFCIMLSLYLFIFEKKNIEFNEFLKLLFLIITCFVPILFFNWLCFKKISLWVSKPKKIK